MTYLEAQMELEGILADLACSARVIFFHHFVFKNFDSEKSYLDFKSFSFELRCRSEYSNICLNNLNQTTILSMGDSIRGPASTALCRLHRLHLCLIHHRIVACDQIDHAPLLGEQWEETSRPLSQNGWNSNWDLTEPFENSRIRLIEPGYSDNYYLKNVLQWQANAGTLRKKFEKNKLGNIRLRAVPVQK